MKKDILNINVFNGDDGIKYIRYDDMVSMLNRIKEDNEERDEEIERLNNIINELEKYIIDFKEDYGNNEFQPNAKVYIYWKDLIDKLQELKGSE